MLATDERFTTRVGAIALAIGAAAIVFFTVFYDRIDWHDRIRVRVYFNDVGGLREGALFIVAGRSVGRVESIAFARDRRLAVTVAIDADFAPRIHVPADVFIGSRGVVSERYLELANPAHDGRQLHDGDELIGVDPATLDSVLNRTLASMTLMRAFAAELQPQFDALRVQLACLRDRLPRAELVAMVVELDAARLELDRVRGHIDVDRTRSVIGEARVVVADARAAIDGLVARFETLRATTELDIQAQQLLARIEPLVAQLRTALGKADAVLERVAVVEARIARGEGSLLKLIFDPEFPEDMKDLGKVIKRQPWKMVPPAGR